MDSLPGGDPKDAIKKIADDLKEKAKSAGLGGADAFVDKLEDIKDAAAKGPGDVLDKITGAFDEFKKKIDNAIANPGSLAPGGGAMAACASYYGNAVVSKLKVVADEANELLQAIMKVAADLAEAFKSLAATMGK